MRLLLIFLKEPVPGQVKSRLASDVGDELAAQYYIALVEVLLRQLQGLNNTRIRFCYAPDDADEAIRFWLLPLMKASSGTTESVFLAPSSPAAESATQEIDFHPQGVGPLGERLHRAFERGFDEGFREIAIISTNAPDCGARWVNAAFARLASDPNRHGVIGPHSDGGSYLLALQSPTPELFNDVPWGSREAFSSILTTAQQSNLTLEQLPALPAITHIEDWHRLIDSPLGPAIKKALGESLDTE